MCDIPFEESVLLTVPVTFADAKKQRKIKKTRSNRRVSVEGGEGEDGGGGAGSGAGVWPSVEGPRVALRVVREKSTVSLSEGMREG